MKKALSVVMALAMLLCCFSVMASAEVKDAVLQIDIKPTSTNYKKGDVVTFEVFYESTSDLGLMGAAFYFSVGYDSSVFETIDDFSAGKKEYPDQSTVITAGYPVDNNIVPANSFVRIDKDLNPADTARGWDSVLFTSQTPTGPKDDDYSTKKASFAFKLRIKTDAADDGCYTIGITDWSIQNYKTEIDEEIGSIAGPSGPDYGFDCANIFELIDGTVTMAASDLEVNHLKNQIRFQKTGAAYADKFDYRFLGAIPQASFNEIFGSESAAQGPNKNDGALRRMGFVFAEKNTVGTFDTAAAKALVENGTAAAGYTLKTVNYLQRPSAEGGNYVFSCIVKNNKTDDAINSNEVYAYAFVEYEVDGETKYAYWEAAQQSTFNSQFKTGWAQDPDLKGTTCPVE